MFMHLNVYVGWDLKITNSSKYRLIMYVINNNSQVESPGSNYL